MDRRLGRAAFLAAWAPIFFAQLGLLANMANTSMPEQGGLPPVLVWAGIAALQLAKLPLTAFRLNDLGRPASDALFYCLLPVANIVGLATIGIEGTPNARTWDVRRRAWAAQLGPLRAIGDALPLVLRSAPAVAPVAVVYGAVMALGGKQAAELITWAHQADPATRSGVGDALGLLTLLLLAYTALQFTKRQRASRVSWLPSVLLLPVALFALGLRFYDASQGQNIQFMLMLAFTIGWQALWMSFGGAALMVAATVAAEQVRAGGAVDPGATLGAVRSRTLDVAGPHGARVQAILVGNQVVIPGIFYMLQLAFADTIAVLKPEAAALKESGQLTWGIRGRLFKLFLVLIVVTLLAQVGAMTAIDGPEAAMAYFIDPRQVSIGALTVSEVLWAVSAWWTQVALLLLYHDRVAYLRQRREERAAQRTLTDVSAPAAG